MIRAAMIRAMSHSIAARWQAFWFAPAPVTNLAIARLLFFLGLTVFYLPHDFSGWGDVSPALYFSRRLRPVMVLAGIGMILGIRALMGPTFENFLLINLFWVPWDRVEEWVRARTHVTAIASTSVAAAAPVAAGAPAKPHVAEMR